MEQYTIIRSFEQKPYVLKAYDEVNKRFVVIKYCHEEELENYLQVKNFSHLNFLPILYEYWSLNEEQRNTLYYDVVIVIEFFEGETFYDLRHRWRNESSRSFPDSWNFLRALLRSITSLHEAGFIFGDLNDKNILWDGHNIKLVDLDGIEPFKSRDDTLYIGEISDIATICWIIGNYL